MAEFKKYMHIERLGAAEVDGIVSRKCYIFSKIDGANGSVWIDQTKHIKCGSRNLELSDTNNNRGFTQWVKNNVEKFKKLFTDYPHVARVYGEWLVPHVIKYYEKSKYENFYVFDVMDINDTYIEYDSYKPWLEDCDIDYIPLITKITDPVTDDLKRVALNDNRFLIQETDTRMGEGIVIKNYEFLNRFKRVCWAKLITADVLKEQKRNQNDEIKEQQKLTVEDKIVEKYVPDHFIDKMIAILVSRDENLKRCDIRKAIYVEFLKEEAQEFLQAFENARIRPQNLRVKVYAKVDKRFCFTERQ